MPFDNIWHKVIKQKYKGGEPKNKQLVQDLWLKCMKIPCLVIFHI